jgi:uncharacterized protein YraI
MKSTALPILLAGLLPVLASAQQIAMTAEQINLRAGPDSNYPIVSVLQPNSQVIVQGCLQDYSWCDVGFGPVRGWVYAGVLRYPYQNGYAILPQVAPMVGIGVIGFAFGDYWHSHYRGQPWYREQNVWVHSAPPPRYVRPGPAPREHGEHDRGYQERPAPVAPAAPLPPGARGNSGWDPSQLNAPRPDRP